MLIGPKYKICKRLGSSVFEKCQTQKFQLAEGRSPRRSGGRRGNSSYGAQMLEKQKARLTYGLTERQFSRYVTEAMDLPAGRQEKGGTSAQALLTRLERRLDNVVFRLGFAKTRRAARQMVSHGHVAVNGRRMSIPSYPVGQGDSVTVRQESRGSALFANRGDIADMKTPSWAELHPDGLGANIQATPTVSETESPFTPATIIQFYSR